MIAAFPNTIVLTTPYVAGRGGGLPAGLPGRPGQLQAVHHRAHQPGLPLGGNPGPTSATIATMGQHCQPVPQSTTIANQ